ncbi:hypothetical protein [Secundilactobacillus odoratitofui]|uniref:hypothetical protein n=1 Tax=Secundilactobacillus odoratitofui TaxID=480930 RepID=UPI0006CFAF3B|nr:hypothetical protein [Secundilactobacillus odoratitofui]
MKQNRWAWYTLGLIIVIGLVAMIWTSVVAVANVWFMVGLAFFNRRCLFLFWKKGICLLVGADGAGRTTGRWKWNSLRKKLKHGMLQPLKMVQLL